VKPEQASIVTMRMPTLRPFGEGSTCGEAIDTRTHAIRRGSGLGMLEKVVRSQRGRPVAGEGSGLNITLGDGHGGSRTGQYERGDRVTPVEQRAPTSDALIEEGKVMVIDDASGNA